MAVIYLYFFVPLICAFLATLRFFNNLFWFLAGTKNIFIRYFIYLLLKFTLTRPIRTENSQDFWNLNEGAEGFW